MLAFRSCDLLWLCLWQEALKDEYPDEDLVEQISTFDKELANDIQAIGVEIEDTSLDIPVEILTTIWKTVSLAHW